MEISNVFVVDDSRTQCDFYVSMCQSLLPRAEVRFSYRSTVVLEQLRHTHTNIVLVDLEMPEMDGVELIGHLVNERLCDSIIIMSAKPESLIASVVIMAETLGMKVLGSLKKPLTAELLQAAFSVFENSEFRKKSKTALTIDASKSDLTNAIINREFISYYQPKIRLKDGFVGGVEALARWQHPVHGTLSPFYFIEEMEKYSLIDTLTLQLLDLTLENKVTWETQSFDAGISINLSPRSLINTGFADWIEEHVLAFGLKPATLTLEITENALLGDLPKSIQTLARMRLKGFNIAIDDYGTGFANAQQLSRIPATMLKLDRSLIAGVDYKPQQEKVLRSTVALANDLGMETVAEGVETQREFEMVNEMGVDMVQGFFFARPMPAGDIELWAKNFKF